MMCGCQGVNGGGWAHYVGQEKVRPLTGWSARWPSRSTGSGPPGTWPAPRCGTSRTDQWRYEGLRRRRAGLPARPWAARNGRRHGQLQRSWPPGWGWMPSHPDLQPQPARPGRRGRTPRACSSQRLRHRAAAKRQPAASPPRTPTTPANWPRVLMVWRANLFASSMKGHEYMLKHLLGTDNAVTRRGDPPEGRARRGDLARRGAPPQERPVGVRSISG